MTVSVSLSVLLCLCSISQPGSRLMGVVDSRPTSLQLEVQWREALPYSSCMSPGIHSEYISRAIGLPRSESEPGRWNYANWLAPDHCLHSVWLERLRAPFGHSWSYSIPAWIPWTETGCGRSLTLGCFTKRSDKYTRRPKITQKPIVKVIPVHSQAEWMFHNLIQCFLKCGLCAVAGCELCVTCP